MEGSSESRAPMKAGPQGKIIAVFGDETHQLGYANLLLSLATKEKPSSVKKRPAGKKKGKKEESSEEESEEEPEEESPALDAADLDFEAEEPPAAAILDGEPPAAIVEAAPEIAEAVAAVPAEPPKKKRILQENQVSS